MGLFRHTAYRFCLRTPKARPGETMARMPGSEPGWLRRAEHAEFDKVLQRALADDDILLYDAFGKPILKDSDLCTAGEEAWRRSAHEFLDDLLDGLPHDEVPRSEEALVNVLKRFVH